MEITELDYEILKRIPVYPEEKTRGQIVQEIKAAYPDGEYELLTTTPFDQSLMKYTKMFPLVEDKNIPDSLFFQDKYDDADCLQSTLEPLPLTWIYAHIGCILGNHYDDVYKELMSYCKPTRSGWYRQSDFHLR